MDDCDEQDRLESVYRLLSNDEVADRLRQRPSRKHYVDIATGYPQEFWREVRLSKGALCFVSSGGELLRLKYDMWRWRSGS